MAGERDDGGGRQTTCRHSTKLTRGHGGTPGFRRWWVSGVARVMVAAVATVAAVTATAVGAVLVHLVVLLVVLVPVLCLVY